MRHSKVYDPGVGGAVTLKLKIATPFGDTRANEAGNSSLLRPHVRLPCGLWDIRL